MRKFCFYLLLILSFTNVWAQKKKARTTPSSPAAANDYLKPVLWRNIGPARGGRSVAVSGIPGNPLVYYAGTTGGGLWKTTDAGQRWFNISDGYFTSSSVGAIAVAASDPNVVYVGMGEHAPRGVMTSYGDGVYKSTDAGKSWTKLGLELTRHIAGIVVHPQNPEVVYVAAQGALHGPGEERGVYKSADGGRSWKKVLYVDANTGSAHLVMDANNPRILYATMWDHRRLPWQVVSGGKGSGLYKSTDAGESWVRLENGLPKELGKTSISVSGANSDKVYALIESDSEKEQGGVFMSADGGQNWTRVSKDHSLIQRAWYYTEIFADPKDENTVYALNETAFRSIDGGKSWEKIDEGTHSDHHHLWINPGNTQNMIMANDGGPAITFNGGATWSDQNRLPTAQFYRINADNLFPYHLYAGQQDNSSVKIASRSTAGGSIDEKEWWASAGGESAFLAFDPQNPRYVMGGSYQGTLELLDAQTGEGKPVMPSPVQYLAAMPKNMQYRFNWNAPVIYSAHEPNTFYHGGNVLFKTTDKGKSWQVVSPDLTRNDTTKQGKGGAPYTNEGAGGENYNTLSYVAESAHEKGVIWTGSDDGLVHLTRDGGRSWSNVTPKGLPESLINSIEVSPHDKGTAYIATTRYKFNDFSPALYKTTNYGQSWTKISDGIPYGAFTRVVREDDQRKDLLYAGTETGLYVSFDGGNSWMNMQLNLPVTPVSDLKVHQGDLLAATQGRSFWILDDLNPIRQYDSQRSREALHLYQPEDAYRVSGYSAMDGTDVEKVRKAVMASSGTNPATGVVVYYQLPQQFNKDSLLSLEILDEAGNVIRTYTNQEDKEFVSFDGGPSAEALLPTQGGLNRFVWDMRYPTLPGVPTVYIEGSYRGHKVAPGTYQARLKAGGAEQLVRFRVLADPRIEASTAEYAKQQEVLQEVEGMIRDVHSSVLRMRKVRQQFSALTSLLEGQPGMEKVVTEGKESIKKMEAWESELVQNKSQSFDDVINFENKLSAHLIFLKGQLDVNIPFVTEAQQKRLQELKQDWAKQQQKMNALLEQDVARFNTMSRDAQLQQITLPAAGR
ncbi:glycosyl hydrolase [Cesiribacter sp. SM1]|uniref:VPS10 domain-containing protein n=1 Tax=Cesiribacter sp. SM1 TaxID=2861196 RepID=UPI001CD42583|nr:glycosyl hydrolase [Cesiribacter sp. SM1]